MIGKTKLYALGLLSLIGGLGFASATTTLLSPVDGEQVGNTNYLSQVFFDWNTDVSNISNTDITISQDGQRDIVLNDYQEKSIIGIIDANDGGWHYSLAIDGDDNIYVGGYFYGDSISFGSTTLFQSGSHDVFVAKMNSNGIWERAKKAGGTSRDRGQSISVDISGSVYVVGYFQSSSIDFGGTILTNSGINDMFIAKIDTDGNRERAKRAGGTSSEIGNSVSVDDSGNAYIAGYCQSSSIDFGGTILTNSGSNDVFIAKIDTDGNREWAKKMGSSQNEYIQAVDIDSSGNVYAVGYFSAPIIVGGTTLTSSGGNDVFIVKLDTDGNREWAKRGGGTGNDEVSSIAIDSQNNIYLGGASRNSVGPSVSTFGEFDLDITEEGSVLLLGLNSNGEWISAETKTDQYSSSYDGIVVDSEDNRFLLLDYTNDPDWDEYWMGVWSPDKSLGYTTKTTLKGGSYTRNVEVEGDTTETSDTESFEVSGPCDAITVIPNEECRALANLYYGTFGDEWSNDTNWMTNTSPWYGVTTDGSGHVIGLSLGSNSLNGGLTPEMFSGLTYLEILDIGGNGNISKIAPNTFAGLENLTYLDLYRVDVRKYNKDTFVGLYNLEYLEFGNTISRSLEPGIFRDLGNLQYLYFESSDSEDLYSGFFQGLSSLTGLDLYLNGKPKIHSYAFNGLTSMEHLDLSDTYFNVNGIESNAFYGMPNLKTLNLYGAKLGSLPANAFAGLESLTGLNLESAKVGSIHPTAFDGLTNLEELYLGDNHKLEILPVGVFDDLENLKVLDIYGGRLSELPTGIFDNNPLLTTLTLNGNTIRELPEGIFANNPLLETIALNDNLIEDIEPTEFTSLENVTTLAFDSNCLGVNNTLTSGQIDFLDNFPTPQVADYGVNATRTSQKGEFQCKGAEVEATEVCSGITIYNETACHALINFYKNMNGPNWNTVTNRGTNNGNWNGFGKNASGDITSINLSSNNVRGSLTPELFSGMEKVTSINLEGSKIPNIAAGTFANMTGISTLMLNGCSIENIEPYAFGELANLTRIDLYNNKLTTIHPNTFVGLDNLQELSLYNNKITEIPVNAFAGLDSLTDLQLYRNKIKTLYSGSFLGLSSLNFPNRGGARYFIKQNEIEVLPRGVFNGLDSLTSLNLKKNKIRTIETGAFDGLNIENLSDIQLQRNEIEQFPWQELKQFTNLNSIMLSKNKIESLPETRDWLPEGMANGGGLRISQNKIKSIPNTWEGTTGLRICLYDNYLTELPSEDPEAFGVRMITNTKEDKEYDQYEEEGEDIEENRKNKKEETETIEIQDVSMNNDSLSNNCLGVLSPLDAIQQEALDYFDVHGARQKTYDECVLAYTETPEDKEAPVVSGITNGSTYTTSATFSVTDDTEVTSVTLNGESITERTNVTITEIGTHILIAKDAANNTTTVSFTIKKRTTSGGGSTPDYCPEGDRSGNYYDNMCDSPREETKGDKGTDEENAKEIVEVVVGGGTRTVKVTREIKEAYEFAKEKKITTTEDIEEFEPEGKLIRMHLAKMVSEFAVEVMGKTEKTEGVEGCENFKDMEGETEEMQKYATMACKLGLMGRESDQTTVANNFNPNNEVNRAQFGTILSRLLRGDTYATEDSIRFYQNHLQALKEEGIMSITDPDMEELRGRVVLMLYRVADKK